MINCSSEEAHSGLSTRFALLSASPAQGAADSPTFSCENGNGGSFEEVTLTLNCLAWALLSSDDASVVSSSITIQPFIERGDGAAAAPGYSSSSLHSLNLDVRGDTDGSRLRCNIIFVREDG